MPVQNDLRYAFRRVLKNPGFSLYVLVTLIVGFGATTAIYSMIQGLVVRAVPFEDPDRLVALWESQPARGIDRYEIAPATFIDWKTQNEVFENIVAYQPSMFNLGAQGGEPDRVPGVLVTPGIFPLLGKGPTQGRGFQESDGFIGAEPVVVLSHSFWQNRFGGESGWIGKSIVLDGLPHTVIGILPADFQYARGGYAHVWKPLILSPQEAANRTSHWLMAVARLRDGVSFGQARSEMKALAARIEQEHIETNEGFGATVIPLADEVSSNYRTGFYALLATVLFLLLLACVNLSTLQLTRALDREKPIAIQSAVGASRWAIVRQLMVENLVLGLIGLIPAFFVARWITGATTSLLPEEIRGFVPGEGQVNLDMGAVVFILLLMLATVMAFGLFPALQASRPDLVNALKEGGGRGGWNVRSNRIRSTLVIAQVALTALLLVISGLVLRSYQNLQQVQTGFVANDVYSVELELPEATYPAAENVLNFQRLLLGQLGGQAGIESVAAIDILPFSGKSASTSFTVPDPSTRDPSDQLSCLHRSVTPEYLDAMGITLVSGRFFGAQDHAEASPTVVINQPAAQMLWPEGDVLGKHLIVDVGDNLEPREIIGVVANVKTTSLAERLRVQVYLPFDQVPSNHLALVARASGGAQSVADAVKGSIRSLDPNLPVSTSLTMKERVENSLVMPRLISRLILGFAFVALVLGASGIYSIMAYYIHQRSREVGLRLALGAAPDQVRTMVLKRGLKLMIIGGIVGMVLAILSGGLLSGLLYGVTAFDPIVHVGVLVALVLIALVASYFPARKAAQVNPVIVMQYD